MDEESQRGRAGLKSLEAIYKIYTFNCEDS